MSITQKFINLISKWDITHITKENGKFAITSIKKLSKKLFVTFPETKSQGLFHQIQKEVTFCGLPHEAYA